MRRLLLFAPLLVLALGLGAVPGAVAAEVVAIVSARSPVAALTPAQVADIFLGKASRFPNGMQAQPIDLPEESAVRDRFYLKYTGKAPSQVKAHWSKMIFTGRGQPPREARGASEARKLVAENPAAIGYIDQEFVDSSVRVVGARP